MAQKKKTILIIAPHPDDELVGCGGVYLKNARAGNNVFVLYLTTGALRGEEQKAAFRRRAVLKIAQENGIPARNLTFLNNHESGALLDVVQARNAVDDIHKLIKDKQPDEVYVTAYEGGHIDHDLANLFVAAARKKTKTTKITKYYEYEVYNNYIPASLFGLKKLFQMALRETIKKMTRNYFYWDESRFPQHKDSKPFTLQMSRRELHDKLALFDRYRTLAEQPLDGLKPRKLFRPYKGKDLLRKMPVHNYARPPHPSFPLPLGYRLAFGIPFSSFKALTKSIQKIRMA